MVRSLSLQDEGSQGVISTRGEDGRPIRRPGSVSVWLNFRVREHSPLGTFEIIGIVTHLGGLAVALLPINVIFDFCKGCS